MLPLAAVAVLATSASSAVTREARFADPPADCRLLPIRHNQPRDAAANIAEIRKLARDGFGGYVGNVPFGEWHKSGPHYVEDELAWPSVVAGAEFARKLGLSLWLYDELGYPSLSGGDLVLRGHPELEQTGWLVASAVAKGGETVRLDVPPGRFLRALAIETDPGGRLKTASPLDVSAFVRDEMPLPVPFARATARPSDAAGRPKLGLADSRKEIRTGPFVWTAPGGADWRVYVITEDFIFEGTHPECKGMKLKFRYPNPLLKAAAERFVSVTHEAYARHFGPELGKHFVSTFTDEPSLMGNWWRPMPYFVLSSAPGLAERYGRRTRGRDLVSDIPYLLSDSADENVLSGNLRVAFWDESARMFEEAFFRTLSSWCRSHGFRSGGHLMGEEDFAFHVSHYGDFFRCLKALDVPSIDCLTSVPSNVPFCAALLAGSARELIGADLAMAEVSDHREARSNPRREVGENEILGTLNRLLWGGINVFASYYDWRRFSEEQVRRINLQIGRAVTLFLRHGHTVADVAVFYPAKDAMRIYRPQLNVWNSVGEPVRELQAVFDRSARMLYEDGRCFMIVDEETLERATVEGDELAYRDLRWKVVVLPAVTELSSRAKATVERFRTSGGVVVRSDGKTDVAAAVREALEPHVTVCGDLRPSPLRFAHRRSREGDAFFVMNDSPQAFDGELRFCGDPKELVFWNLSDGTHMIADKAQNGGVRAVLPGHRACVFTTETACQPLRRLK